MKNGRNSDLFTQPSPQLVPLADRLRPTAWDDVVGQDDLTRKESWLRQITSFKRPPSLILWGPPGTGKTTLAKIIAQESGLKFITLSAVNAGTQDIRDVVDSAKQELSLSGRGTLLFLDEIHRFNKAQQDALLPHVENGTLTLIGATTENPSFEINSALLSRARVVVLRGLDENDLKTVLQRALTKIHSEELLSPEAQSALIRDASGDARYLLNRLDDILKLKPGAQNLSLQELTGILHPRSLLHDKNAEHHYNLISAFIKSLRGSDPDAALYYLARLLESGEDPRFVARRMVILASEDIGNANPQALTLAVSAFQAFDLLGAAEGWIPLAHCAVYLSCSPKSNATYAGYKKAQATVRERGALDIPLHLRNAATKLLKSLDYGKDYKYAHDFAGSFVSQQHLPDLIKEEKFYHPTGNGHEEKIRHWLTQLRDSVNKADRNE